MIEIERERGGGKGAHDKSRKRERLIDAKECIRF